MNLVSGSISLGKADAKLNLLNDKTIKTPNHLHHELLPTHIISPIRKKSFAKSYLYLNKKGAFVRPLHYYAPRTALMIHCPPFQVTNAPTIKAITPNTAVIALLKSIFDVNTE
nr:MAG TPA: hypothetical protein [Inoviridae sp.]